MPELIQALVVSLNDMSIMSNHVTLEFIDCHQFDNGLQNKVTIFYCKASEILKNKSENVFPLTPNVRNPRIGRITNNILKSLKENPKYCIESPIVLIAKSVAILSGNKVFIEFGVSDGVLDGGHRLLAARYIRMNGTDPSQVIFCFKVIEGLSKNEIIKLGESLNISIAPTKQSIHNYRGEYDWLKSSLKYYEFDISYYDNQNIGREDTYCQIYRLISFIILLDASYNSEGKASRTKMQKYRHPINYQSQLFSLTKNGLQQSSENFVSILFGILMQSRIALSLEKSHIKSPLPRVKHCNNKSQRTYLPTGETLSVKLPSRMYVYPMISSYRAIFEDIKEWLYIKSVEGDIDCIKKQLYLFDAITVKQIARFRKILSSAKFQGRTTDSILQDELIWEEMYQICKEIGSKIIDSGAFDI